MIEVFCVVSVISFLSPDLSVRREKENGDWEREREREI